ncbi:molybdopterin molybdotransferase MoeA [Azospirillum doebereinerae]|uniref:Molybdopterin molybdenumtransferase n=1 Tax=Azospirillum doebereinerae TaxID=92933 RepID=A0A433J8G2_9PROT|nr:gephyrin-like molybdotransferase Glp [Azospirillum doebereinerae]MCG5240399.1 molybdopterin molybdotransferase MoeA [Azospirillum doebereinerae]RUQ70263.1 molybdopterin molybdenumtransferase MoeA [Azospirillum doebereinerae]
MDDCTAQAPTALSLDEAVARIDGSFGAVTGTEEVPLRAALGRVLAEDVVAPLNVPPADVSAMDGWGYAAGTGAETSDGMRRLTVVGRVPAGSSFEGALKPGEAVRIFTGAPVPAGADTVAMQEDCRTEGDAVLVPAALKRASNVRPMGEDMTAGSVVLHPGQRMRAQEVGLAAAVGRAALTVRKRLRVVLFSTGDELREPGQPKPSHAIYDANRYTLAAQLDALGVEVRDLGILPDRPDATRAALAEAAGTADLLVTSGGVSVGEEDHVKAAVNALGSIDLWTLAIKPGKPLALGRVGTTPFLGLPGNPVSAMVTFLLVGRPLVLRLSGATSTATPRSLVVAGFSFDKKPGRREFLRARLERGEDGRPLAVKFPSNSSGVLTSMVEADGLVDVPAESRGVRPGDLVDFLPFTGLFA